jgi:hypothetical protein
LACELVVALSLTSDGNGSSIQPDLDGPRLF